MFIDEAIKEAMKTGTFIYRKSVRRSDSEIYSLIKPTVQYDICQMYVCRYGIVKKKGRDWWSPTADDLVADDWECWKGKENVRKGSEKSVYS